MEKNGIKCFGSDEDKALRCAIRRHFPQSKMLLCLNHIRQNVLKKITSLKFPDALVSLILRDIFGTVQNRETSLVNSNSVKAFKKKYRRLKNNWSKENRFDEKFIKWFEKNKIRKIKQYVLKPRLNFQNHPDLQYYTQNTIESMNRVIKTLKNKKRLHYSEICNLIEEKVNFQKNESIRALFGSGEYKLSTKYDKFEYAPTNWFNIPDSAREKHIEKFLNYRPKKKSTNSIKELYKDSIKKTTKKIK